MLGLFCWPIMKIVFSYHHENKQKIFYYRSHVEQTITTSSCGKRSKCEAFQAKQTNARRYDLEIKNWLPLARFTKRIWPLGVSVLTIFEMEWAGNFSTSLWRNQRSSFVRWRFTWFYNSTCASARSWCCEKKGAQKIGRSAGGPTTKIHLVTDNAGNPELVKLSRGNVHDIETAFEFLDELPSEAKNLLADKGYDSDLFRKCIKSGNREPIIPGRKNRRKEIVYDKEIYSGRHVVENAFCSLKQFRSIATRYEKLDSNFLSMVLLGCILCWARLWKHALISFSPFC